MINAFKELKQKQFVNESKRMLFINSWRRRLVFWSGGLLVGLLCVVFAMGCDHLDRLFSVMVVSHPYAPLIISPLGFVAIVWLTRRYFNGAEGSGIPQVIAALEVTQPEIRKSLVSLRIACGKFILTMCGFLVGASLGREGPTIQLSASFMQALNKWGTFHRHDAERGLLLAGGAAGIAAAFNAPLAGIVFAIEELSGSFEKGLSGTIITVVVLAGVMAQAVMGNYFYFGSSAATTSIFSGGWLPILVVGVVAGFCGAMFSRILVGLSTVVAPWIAKYRYRIVALLGFLVAVIGVVSAGATYGSGYEAARSLITHDPHHVVSFWYAPLKMLATLLTYLCGLPGGIFAPSLSIGAGFGLLISPFFPAHAYDAIILLSMVAYFSATAQSPITSFVIVLELTDSSTSNMTLPLMLASLIATGVSKSICREPLYQTLAERYLKVVREKKRVVEEEGTRE
jgi:H+/Cl- antiporter ClcA